MSKDQLAGNQDNVFECNDISIQGGYHGRDRMVVGYTTSCAISADHQ